MHSKLLFLSFCITVVIPELQSMKKMMLFSTVLVSLHLWSMNDTKGVDLIMLLNKLCSCNIAGVLLLFRLLLCHFLSSHILLS